MASDNLQDIGIEPFEGYEQHKSVGMYVPDRAETALLAEVEDNLYGRIREDGLTYDQASAFQLFAETGKEIGDRDMLPKLSRALGAFASGDVAVLAFSSELSAPYDLPTPSRYLEPDQNPVLPQDVRRALMFGMLGLHAYGYTSQQPGNLWNNVVALEEYDGLKGTSANAKQELGFHIEDASFNKSFGVMKNGLILPENFDASPDVLTNHFLRNPLEIPTTISLPDVGQLDSEIRETLFTPSFINHTNPGQGGKENDIDVPTAILSGDPNRPNISANMDNIVAINRLGDVALRAFKSLVENDHSRVKLRSQPGDMNFINNRLVFHGRSPYPERTPENAHLFHGKDSRWQRRLVGMYSLERLLQFEDGTTDSRIINPQRLQPMIDQIAA